MNFVLKKAFVVSTFVLSFSAFCFSQNTDSAIKTMYDEDSNKTTILLSGIKLPNNKDSFSVGAFFEYNGEKLEKPPCCAVIFFTSISKKKFKFKENHTLTIWADKEKFSFNDVNWQESAGGTAFIIAKIAFPEEMLVGMKSEIFQKIAISKKVKMQLGDYRFTLPPQHLKGFRKLLGKMKAE